MELSRDNRMAGRQSTIDSNSLAIYIRSFFTGKECYHISNLQVILISKWHYASNTWIQVYLERKTITSSRVQLANLVSWTASSCIIKGALGHTSFNQALTIPRLVWQSLLKIHQLTGQMAFTRISVPAYWNADVWQRLITLFHLEMLV